jgi:hypothetical protein
MHRLVIVPRWSGDAHSDWYPWLRDELFGRFSDLFATIEIVQPDPQQAPEIERSVAALCHALDADDTPTWLIGHSVGTQIVMRALAQCPVDYQAAGALLVAPWFSIDEPWDSIRPWTETPIDTMRTRTAIGRTVALVSDNDPFTSDFASTRSALEWRLGADVRIVAQGAHFNAPAEPIVLGSLLKLRAGG